MTAFLLRHTDNYRFTPAYFFTFQLSLYQEETILVPGSLTVTVLQLWRPMLVKDTEALERIQKRATKFILGTDSGDYKARLVKLKLLPLMYSFELADIMLIHIKIEQTASA